MPTDPISHSELRELLENRFPKNKPLIIFLRDRNYAFVDTDWLVNKTQAILKDNKRSGLAFGPRWDCDNFANDLVLQVSKEHARTGGVDAEGVAVGWVMYKSGKVGYHIAVVTISPDRELLFLEPQTGSLFELTEEEEKSVCVVYC